jgi:hypothetical protein
MTPPRTAAPHVQAALARTVQARIPVQRHPAGPGRPPAPHVQAPHVQAKIAAVQAKIVPHPVPRPVAAHVQAKIQAPPVRPLAPHLPPPRSLPVPPALAAQARASAPPPVPRPPVPNRAPFLAPPPGRPAARPPAAAIQRSAVIQPAIQVSYFTSIFAKRARHYRRDNAVGGRNLATVRYRTKSGGSWGIWKYKTLPSEGLHSEKRLYDFLEDLGVEYQVDWVYTELAPCGSDYHNCAQRLEDWWPTADVYYSVDYPSVEDVSSESSDDDEQTKKRNKAKRRRKRGTGTLGRLGTKSRKYDSDEDDAPDPGDFKPALRRIYSPVHYSSGWEL